MAKIKTTIFEYQHCGNQQSRWLGRCPDCGAFDSFVELKPAQIKALKEIEGELARASSVSAKAISEIQIEQISRIDTKDSELNLVLGAKYFSSDDSVQKKRSCARGCVITWYLDDAAASGLTG